MGLGGNNRYTYKVQRPTVHVLTNINGMKMECGSIGSCSPINPKAKIMIDSEPHRFVRLVLQLPVVCDSGSVTDDTFS